MPDLVARTARALRDRCLVLPGDRVVVALSGGPDSVALTLLLDAALPAVGASLAGAAHLHHGLRGRDADEDEAFCRTLAARIGLPIVVEHANLRVAAGRSVESLAHDARYAFYDRARTALVATHVATGHTRNDVAETVLLRLLRGAGLHGLSGIRPVNGPVIRPLLEVDRADLLEFLYHRGQSFRRDPTNADTSIPRNRIRHEILPFLERHAGGGLIARLARSADLAAEDDVVLEALATELAGSVVQENGQGVVLKGDTLAALPLAVRRRIVRGAIHRLTDASSLATVDRVLGLLGAREGARIDAPGVESYRAGADVVLARARDRRGAGNRVGDFRPTANVVGELQVPGRLLLPGGGWIGVEERERSGVTVDLQTPDAAVMDATAVRLPLRVRFRSAGDRFRPLGMQRPKKLQDVFVDRKVPRAERDRVPLVVDADGRILWVAGHVVSDEARVSPATSSVLLFEYRR